MKKFLSLFLSLFVFSAFADVSDFQPGAFYVYSGNPVEQYAGQLKTGYTYEVNESRAFVSNTNQSILYFSNELIVHVGTNTEYNVVTFDQQLFRLFSPPSKLKAGKHSLILSLTSGEMILNATTPEYESSTIVNTPFGDVEINSSATVLLKVESEQLFIYCYNGKVLVYANRGNPEVVEKQKQLTSRPNKFPMRGDNRKYQVGKKQPDREELVLLNERLPKQDIDVRGDVMFVLINKRLVGINIH